MNWYPKDSYPQSSEIIERTEEEIREEKLWLKNMNGLKKVMQKIKDKKNENPSNKNN